MSLPPEIEAVKKQVEGQYLTPHKIEMPAHVLKQFVLAAQATDLAVRGEHLKKAREKAEITYLAKWAKGEIRVKDEDTEPMPEDVKVQLKQLNEKRREEKRAAKEAQEARNKELRRADLDKPKRVAKKKKQPVFDDPNAQKLVTTKYPWTIPGTFRQDPDKPGATNLDIKCQLCGMARSIHLADAFQVKYCSSCKGTNANRHS